MSSRQIKPLVKAVRGLDYPMVKVETEEKNLSDEDHRGLGRLVRRLHNLTDRLTSESPVRAKRVFAKQIPQLERDLERVQRSIEKQRYNNEKSKRGPRSSAKKYIPH